MSLLCANACIYRSAYVRAHSDWEHQRADIQPKTRIHAHIYIHGHRHIDTHSARLYTHTHTHTHIYMYIYIYTHVGTYIHTYIHTYINIYIYIYIYYLLRVFVTYSCTCAYIHIQGHIPLMRTQSTVLGLAGAPRSS